MPQIIDLAKKEFRLACRLGSPRRFSSLGRDPRLSVVSGLISRGFNLDIKKGERDTGLAGKIADKIGRKPLVIFSQSFFALVMLLYSSINSYIYAFPIHVIEGFAWAMIATAAPALVADLAGRNRRGEAIGIYNTTWNLGWVVGPFLGGTLAHLYGFRLTFKLSFLMIAIGTVLTFLLVDERKFLSKT